jgi:hypothetical protein
MNAAFERFVIRRRVIVAAAVCLAMAAPAAGQAPERELVATISGKTLGHGLVTGLAWDGSVLIIQLAVVEKGEPKARYFAAPGKGMELRAVDAAPATVETYWKRKASRRSPTGMGTIVVAGGSKMPMYGIADQAKRLQDAQDMGGMLVTHEVRLGPLVLNRRTDTAPYDGEVWSWSPAELNRIAYTDEKGDLWVARADGAQPERLLKGRFTLPAWSEDGRVLAFAERKGDGSKWEIAVVHLPDRFRQ